MHAKLSTLSSKMLSDVTVITLFNSTAMLYRYIVENYKSFRNRTEWSLIPTVSKDPASVGIQVQQMNAIYGANASGKSTLVKSMAFMHQVIRNNDILAKSENKCYRMDSESVNRPTSFCVQILCDGVMYDYGFSYLFKSGRIVSEWLYRLLEDGEELIFERELQDQTYAIGFPDSHDSAIQAVIDVYKADMSRAYAVLMLNELAKKDMDIAPVRAAKTVVEWFRNLLIIFPNSRFNLIRHTSEDENKVNDMYCDNFKRFGIDITRIKLETIPAKYLKLEDSIADEIREDLKNERAKGTDAHTIVTIDSTPILLELDDAGDLKAREVVFVHEFDEGRAGALHWKDESDGTNRLFDIIPIANMVADSSCVVIVDELDRSLHSNLTRHFVRYVKEKLQNTRSQFLFTTHDTLLMDTALLNRDEIWMVEKSNGASRLVPLAQYRVKNAEYIRENYLLGRYGGIAEMK